MVKAKDGMLMRFDCDNISEVKGYLGCKIDINKEEDSFENDATCASLKVC